MASRHDFKNNLLQLLRHNKDGSYQTQADRRGMLMQFADELNDGGYKLKHPKGLKRKHIEYLNQQWQARELSAGTIKNRNAALRWLCGKVNKYGVVPTNDELNVGKRVYVTNVNKAIELKDEQLEKITNPRVEVQLQLQKHFGLRREEAIKIQPHVADKGDHIHLLASWCKGGRSRDVPIDSQEARYWLDEAKKLAKTKHESMAGNGKTYKSARSLYSKQVSRAGIRGAHGLRHGYAQSRYKSFSGVDAPVAGGPGKSATSKSKQKENDVARMKVSNALGHGRLNVTSVYLGSNK